MLRHQFCYALKTLFRDRALIFWTFAFPIILGTFFYLAFSDIENSEKLDVIPVAVVENEELNRHAGFREAFSQLSDPDRDDRLFDTVYTTEQEAKQLLEEGKISGYLMMDTNGPQVVVDADGIDQTVLSFAAQEIMETEHLAADLLALQGDAADPAAVIDAITSQAGALTDGAGIRDVSGTHLSYTMIEFYTLIAMTCLYGGMLGMTTVNNDLANMSSKGRRVAVGPTPRGRMIGGSMLAAYLVQLVGIALLFLYTVLVLRVDYGDRLPLIVLLTLCGCLAGLSMGVALAVLVKADDNAKTGIIISVTMAGSYCAGMMGITMKYVIDTHLPLLNRLNPADMITDGLYALYYYDTPDRFIRDVAALLLFSALMLILSVFGLRRQRYERI